MKRISSPSPIFTVRVKIPASSANLGAGFDVLGLALDHYNEVEVSAWNNPLMPPATVQIDGEGASRLPLDGRNLVYRMARRALAAAGRKVTALRVKLVNRIPLARGLGSSSAAIIGGMVAVNVGCGNPLSPEKLLRLAVEEEGHPDNVVPALIGGLCVSAVAAGNVHFLSWKERRLFQSLCAVVCVPYFELSTRAAREVLPEKVSRADAVFNSSRVALFLSALHQRRHDLLGEAMDDRLHQPYRQKLVPGLERVIQAARSAGAWGAALSGAGPSVLALCPPDKSSRVAGAMSDVFRRRRVTALSLNLRADVRGTRVVQKIRNGPE